MNGKKIVVAKIYIDDVGQGPTCDSLKSVMEHLEYILEDTLVHNGSPDAITISFDEMTQSEYDSLTEWQGY